MDSKPTAKILLEALDYKYGKKHAIIREITVEDVIVSNRSKAYYRDNYPRVAADWEKKGIDPASFGSSDGYVPGEETAYRRIDALMVGAKDKAGVHQRTAVEVKISRADFRRDTLEKVRTWQSLSHRFIYLVPAGLIKPDELIDPAMGLWWWHAGDENSPGTIEIVKTAKTNVNAPECLPEELQTRLMWRLAIAEQKVRQDPKIRRKARRRRR